MALPARAFGLTLGLLNLPSHILSVLTRGVAVAILARFVEHLERPLPVHRNANSSAQVEREHRARPGVVVGAALLEGLHGTGLPGGVLRQRRSMVRAARHDSKLAGALKERFVRGGGRAGGLQPVSEPVARGAVPFLATRQAGRNRHLTGIFANRYLRSGHRQQ